MLGKVTFKSNALQYEDAGESACVLAGECEQIPGRLRTRRSSASRGPSASRSLGLDCVTAQGLGAGWLRGCYRSIDSFPDEEVSTRDIVKTSGPDAA